MNKNDLINSKHLDAPLYPGATITFKITMILPLTFAVRHKLSNEAILDLLYIIEILCPKPNLCCKSVYKFKTLFSFLVTPVNLLFLFRLLYFTVNMVCTICNKMYSSVKDLSYFLHISISSQIRALFSRKKFLTAIKQIPTTKTTWKSL